jgi:Zn-finger nucleic acid-binding protein
MLPALTANALERGSDRASAGPYRAPSASACDVREIVCPYCGNVCASALRTCPHCDVRFDSVRCVRCYTLQPPGSFSCGRCGHALELEPVLDVTDAPCPRCMTALDAAGGAGSWEDARLHECPRCGGMFVPREALADILCRAEQNGPFPSTDRAPIVPLDRVTYIPCPLCRTSMNRVNFGKVSGVIVDVCRQHGTWFDGGELTRVVVFAAAGGLVKTRARERQEKEENARQRREVHVQTLGLRGSREAEERLEEWRVFLHELFHW